MTSNKWRAGDKREHNPLSNEVLNHSSREQISQAAEVLVERDGNKEQEGKTP